MKTLLPSRRMIAPFVLVLTALCTVLGSIPLQASSVLGSQPTAVFPANKEVLKCPNASIVLRWNDIPGISTYFVEVATDPEMTIRIAQKVVQFDTSVIVAIPSSSSSFYWTISTGVETSPVSSFTTRFVKTVELLSLFHNAEISSDVVHFAWKTDEAASSYIFQYRLGGEQIRDSIVLGTTVDMVLPREQTTIWRVRSVCKTAMGEWSDPDTLTIAKLVNDVPDNGQQILSVWPQPARDYISVQCAAALTLSNTEVSVTDMMGRQHVLHVRWNEGGCSINTQALTPGVYYLQFKNTTNRAGCSLVID